VLAAAVRVGSTVCDCAATVIVSATPDNFITGLRVTV
jgi:hypothetical protein